MLMKKDGKHSVLRKCNAFILFGFLPTADITQFYNWICDIN